MTDDFIEIVKKEYTNWSENEKNRIDEENQRIKEKIEIYKKIHQLLQDEKVKEFADYIGYVENKNCGYISLKNTLEYFLRYYMTKYTWSDKALKNDKYPIYCFYKSQDPLYSCHGNKLCNYEDLYWNLQEKGYSFGPSDLTKDGKNREKFRIKNINNIIYPPEGESFVDANTFYRIQAEFVEEALRTDQATAKQLIIQKYGRRK